MFLSKPFMKPAVLSFASADAMDANRSTTSAWVSAMPAMDAPAARRTRLRTITRIDFDVLFREVAGPETGFAFTAALNGEAYEAFPLVQLLLQLRFQEIGRETAAADRDPLQVDIDIARFELRPGI